MPSIGYEKEIELSAFLGQMRITFNMSGLLKDEDIGPAIRNIVNATETACNAALTASRAAYELKTTTVGHPYFGKSLLWAAVQKKLLLRDNKLIMQVTQSFAVQ